MPTWLQRALIPSGTIALSSWIITGSLVMLDMRSEMKLVSQRLQSLETLGREAAHDRKEGRASLADHLLDDTLHDSRFNEVEGTIGVIQNRLDVVEEGIRELKGRS